MRSTIIHIPNVHPPCVQLYNINDNGRRDYLSIGDTDLDKVYWVSVGQIGYQ